MKKMAGILIFLSLLLIWPAFTFAQVTEASILLLSNVNRKLATDIVLKIGSSEYPLSKAVMASWIQEKTDLVYNPKYFSEIENSNFCQYKKSLPCSLFLTTANQRHIQKSSTPVLSVSALDAFLSDLERQANKDPENAKLTIDNGKVSTFALSSPGIKLDKEKSRTILLNYFTEQSSTSPIALAYQEIAPEISESSVENLGITSLLGEGHSNFRGSSKSRVFNITVATQRYDGVLIKPNEEFSFVSILGPVDGEHGYLPELVIKKDKTEPEFGGGICQVSTTAFRAAIYSGLKITARKNHAYPVSFYNPQGMDATVYVPRPDLRFLNNTPGYILIQTKIVGTELIFQFFGTSDGRQTTVDGPKILESNPDGSLKTTFSQEVTDKNGTALFKDVFNSNYASPSKYPHPSTAPTPKPKKN